MIAEPFYRSPRHSDVPGTGIGLAIAKQMAELHGGRLRVESELGTGSTFTLVIPCKRPDRVAGEGEEAGV
jgi:signal transduction histidine kinase